MQMSYSEGLRVKWIMGLCLLAVANLSASDILTDREEAKLNKDLVRLLKDYDEAVADRDAAQKGLNEYTSKRAGKRLWSSKWEREGYEAAVKDMQRGIADKQELVDKRAAAVNAVQGRLDLSAKERRRTANAAHQKEKAASMAVENEQRRQDRADAVAALEEKQAKDAAAAEVARLNAATERVANAPTFILNDGTEIPTQRHNLLGDTYAIQDTQGKWRSVPKTDVKEIVRRDPAK